MRRHQAFELVLLQRAAVVGRGRVELVDQRADGFFQV